MTGNTPCEQCGTIGPFHLKPKCPMCGHENVTTEQLQQALRDLEAAQSTAATWSAQPAANAAD
jgi:hypothetical protein